MALASLWSAASAVKDTLLGEKIEEAIISVDGVEDVGGASTSFTEKAERAQEFWCVDLGVVEAGAAC